MTDETRKNRADENAETAENGAAGETGQEAGEAGAGEAAADEALARLTTENADLKDRYLRMAAEMENLRRRTQRDVEDARNYSIASFARDMLAVSDNLRRAIEAVPEESRAGGEEGLKALIEGVEMTERSMLSALERHGVRRIEPEGQKFDPNFHQAMFEVPNHDVPSGTVVQVVQTGYVIGERVLRPAMVGVAKGGPKPAPRDEAPDDGAEGSAAASGGDAVSAASEPGQDRSGSAGP